MRTGCAVVLKPGKEKKVRNNYPWIQRGEVLRVEGQPEDGTLVDLVSHDGGFLAVASWNSHSRFQARVFTKQKEPIDHAFFVSRFERAVKVRESLVTDTNARRIVYSEADQVPGLIADQYDGHIVLQVRSLAMQNLKDVWLPALIEVAKPKSVYERSEMHGRAEEGLPPYTAQLYGDTPDEAVIEESGNRFIVPLKSGLKTGFYLDQRNTRRTLGARVTAGERVLDCFCYSGAFSIYAAKAGASVVGVDISADAIDLAKRNAETNAVDAEFIVANAFDWLEEGSHGPFDWIVLDPPAIAKTRDRRDSLKWAIWKLAHRAIPLLKPGGRMVACSCSYQIDTRELVETVRLAANDRDAKMFLEAVTLQDLDHPAPVQFPEGLYLKCAWLRLG